MPLLITATLFRQGDELTLKDTGAGASLGRTAGTLPDMLASLSVALEDVTCVVLSHLHPDHIGGKLAGGTPSFANGTVHLSDGAAAPHQIDRSIPLYIASAQHHQLGADW